MSATTTRDQLTGVPIAELATRPDPASWHAALRSLGTHARDGHWIVSTPPDVTVALSAPALQVIAPSAGTGPAAELVARMARFCDGAAHQRRRALTVRLLPTAAAVARQAADHAVRYLCEHAAADLLDIMPLARTLPAEAIARAMGLDGPAAARAADLTGWLCDALSAGPRDAAIARIPRTDADPAADRTAAPVRRPRRPSPARFSRSSTRAAGGRWQASASTTRRGPTCACRVVC